MNDASREYERLLEFFYQCPAGLISFSDDGTVDQINPAALNMLTVAARATTFDNVFDCLRAAWPELPDLVAEHTPSGVVVDDHDLPRWEPGSIVVGCTLVRIGADRLMLVVVDATARAELEQSRAELFDSVQQARTRLETLERNATQMVGASTVDEVAAVLTSGLHHTSGLDLTSVRVARDGLLELVIGPGVPSELSEIAASLPADTALPGLVAVRENAVVVVSTPDDVRRQFPVLAEHLDTTIGSLAALPLRAADKTPIGALVVSAPDPGFFDDDAIALLVGLSNQAGLALERALLFEAALATRDKEHDIALRLQQALLPEALVEAPGIRLAARVKAAGDLLAVGGDWYDSFLWPGGEVGAVVGDVVNHDLEAATKMGKLRTATSILAADIEPRASRLIETLDRVASADLGVGFATAACVVLDPGAGRLRWALAGHPPPVVVGPTGETRVLTGGTSMPVGIVHAVARDEAEAAIEPGSTIVLYSDGLVEQRGEALDRGIERLADRLRGRTAIDPDALADELMRNHTHREAQNAEGADDVTVLVMTWSGDGSPTGSLATG